MIELCREVLFGVEVRLWSSFNIFNGGLHIHHIHVILHNDHLSFYLYVIFCSTRRESRRRWRMALTWVLGAFDCFAACITPLCLAYAATTYSCQQLCIDPDKAESSKPKRPDSPNVVATSSSFRQSIALWTSLPALLSSQLLQCLSL